MDEAKFNLKAANQDLKAANQECKANANGAFEKLKGLFSR
jgi:hypothetical protein